MSAKYYHLRVKNIIPETNDAITVVFENPEGNPLVYKPGQFLTLIVKPDGEEERRAYSLCSSPFTDADPAITIKRVKQGKVSNYLNEHLKAGDVLQVMEPAGFFTTDFDPAQRRHLILFGGGSGITPLMSLMKSVLNQEPMSLVSLIYANQSSDTTIFRDQIEQLQKVSGDRLRVVHVLEKAPYSGAKAIKGV